MGEHGELRAFFFTNMYMSSIQRGIQSTHAVARAFVKYGQDEAELLWEWAEEHETIIVLDAGYSEEIDSLANFFAHGDNPYPWTLYNESQAALNGAATCAMIILPEEVFKTAEKVRKGKYKPDKDVEDDTVEKRLEREFGSWKGQLIKRLNQYRLAH